MDGDPLQKVVYFLFVLFCLLLLMQLLEAPLREFLDKLAFARVVQELELGKLLYGINVVEVVKVTGTDAILLHHGYQTLMRHFYY